MQATGTFGVQKEIQIPDAEDAEVTQKEYQKEKIPRGCLVNS
jgi:hypothetical protein